MLALSPRRATPPKGPEALQDIRAVVNRLSETADENGEFYRISPEELVALKQDLDDLDGALTLHESAVETYSELLRNLESTLTIDRHAARATRPRGDHRKVLALAQQRAAEAQLGFGLAHGADVVEATVATVRELLSTKHPLEARSLAFRFMSVPATRDAGRICAAIVASKIRLNHLAAVYLGPIPDEIALRYAATEWYAVKFEVDPFGAFEHFQETAGSHYPSATWNFVIKKGLILGFLDETLSLCRRFLDNSAMLSQSDKADRLSIQFIVEFLLTRQVSAPAGHFGEDREVTVGIWDNSHPDLAGPSADLGLHLESAVLLSRLQRWASLVADRDDLAAAVQGLASRAPDPVPGAAKHSVRIDTVHRFMLTEDTVRVPTWTVFHGQFGDKVFGAPAPFPVGTNVRPIFFGFELLDLSCSDEQMMAALRRYGPVGCRDWTSTYALLGQGVDAFHSGALASLVPPRTDTSVPQAPESARKADLAGFVVRAEDPDNGIRAQQKSARLRTSGVGRNLETAIQYLDALGNAHTVSTPHMETNLIGQALGLNVSYSPPGRAVGGPTVLSGASAPAGVSEHSPAEPLDTVLEMISGGADEHDVYQAWSGLTAGLVAEARRRFSLPPELPKPGFDVEAIGAALRSQTVQAGPADLRQDSTTVNVAMACDANLFNQLAVAIESVQRGTARKLRVHLLSRGLNRDDFDFLGSLFPDIAFDFIPCDSVDYGSVLSTARHLTVSAIDRLLLPSILTTVPKVVYLDVDLMVLDDVAKLFDISMKSVPLAACSATADWSKSGYGHLLAVAQRLDPVRAAHLKHLMLRVHHKDFLAFNSGVLVLNLEQMRADDFCQRFLGFPGHFDMNDQDVLYCYAGNNWRALQPSWNCIPSHVFVTRPRIVHWAGPAKPWHALRMPYQTAWIDLANEVAARATDYGLDAAPLAKLAQADA